MSFVRARDHARRAAPKVVFCDRCAELVRFREHAAAFLRFDVDGLLVEACVTHVACAASRARHVDPAETAEIISAREIDADQRSRLRGLARAAHPGASISRILQKVSRLSRGSP